MKHSSYSKKKHVSISQKDKSFSTSHPATISKIDSLIKQFRETKIALAEAITKADRLEQSQNNCRNCKSSTHTTSNYNQSYKICQGSLSSGNVLTIILLVIAQIQVL